jgi:hypothetical protein
MEEAPENGMESSHSAHTKGMNELAFNRAQISYPILITFTTEYRTSYSLQIRMKLSVRHLHTALDYYALPSQRII